MLSTILLERKIFFSFFNQGIWQAGEMDRPCNDSLATKHVWNYPCVTKTINLNHSGHGMYIYPKLESMH